MPSETGHAKNTANFKSLTVYIESLGDVYKPTKTASQLAPLKTMLAEAEKSLKKLTDAMPAYRMAVDEQEAVFAGLDKLVVRVANAFEACVDNPAQAESVLSLKRAIIGATKRAADPDTDVPTDNKIKQHTRSASQQSYDRLVENFGSMIELVAANKNYVPNEDDLKVASLSAYRDVLKQKTEAVDTVEAVLVNARIERNELLYQENTGVIDTVKAVKKYVSSVYGASSPQMSYINDLNFKQQPI